MAGKTTPAGGRSSRVAEAGAQPHHHQHLRAAPALTPPEVAWVAWLVPAFVLANFAAFAYTMYVNDCPASPPPHSPDARCILQGTLGRFAFEPLVVNPLLGPKTRTLDSLGALNYKKVVGGEGWRLFSCVWLHAGVVHLLANMLSFLFIGVRLEQEFGFARIGTLYVMSGLGGSLLSCLSMESEISVGASGALFGLLGAMLSELITNWSIYANKFVALLTLLVIVAINLSVGIIPHVDSSAHVGGFVSGFLLGFVLLLRPQFGWISRRDIPAGYDMELVKPRHKVYQYLLWVIALVLLVIG
ncbi:RHOMBOID-like protein 1 isoform X2 [Wolffia australiana]